MATETLRPSSNGDVIELTASPGVDNYLNVDESSADDDDTHNYFSTSSGSAYDLYELENSGNSGVINSVKIYARFYGLAGGAGHAGGTCKTKVKINGSEYDGSITGGNSAWQTISETYNTSPDTLDVWTWNEINSMQVGATISEGGEAGPYIVKLTQVYVEVDYEEPPTATILPLLREKGAVETCFIAGTKVTLLTGEERNIEEIKVEDIIISYNRKTKTLEPQKVLSTKTVKENDGYFLINGHLGAVGDQKLMTESGWKRADKLTTKDKLFNIDGEYEEITSIEKTGKYLISYDLTIETNHDYFANKFLAHNPCP